jgi:uncharacterized protein (TIGR02117 family)
MLPPPVLATVLGLFLALAGAGCARSRHSVEMPPATTAGVVHVVFRGWHTDIGLPIDEVGGQAGTGLQRDFPGARYLVFGFGERAFYLNARPAFGDMLLALLPGPGAVLVTALNTTPDEAFGSDNVVELRLTQAGMDGTTRFVSASLDSDGTGQPRRIADGPYPGSLFYATSLKYHAFYTCNAWTAEALARGGLPIIPTGTLFAGQIMEEARRLAEAQSGAASPVSAVAH